MTVILAVKVSQKGRDIKRNSKLRYALVLVGRFVLLKGRMRCFVGNIPTYSYSAHIDYILIFNVFQKLFLCRI